MKLLDVLKTDTSDIVKAVNDAVNVAIKVVESSIELFHEYEWSEESGKCSPKRN